MKLKIPAGDFGGYIFDLDGTLVDTMPLHYRAWNRAMQLAGLREELSEDLFYSLGGMPTVKVAAVFGKHYGLEVDVEKVFHQKEALFLELKSEMKLIEAVVQFARDAVKQGKPVSVASGGPRDIVRTTLELMGLAPLFPVVVTPEDVVHGKPAPDMFLLAAEKMGVPPERCLVFEDAQPGIQAAEAAGMLWVHVDSRIKS
ncbi:HAD family hydrolase [Oleiharenicola lentus]|uniref:HAD family hydrolase n=1 Tax=Oleiharenicola lentus TaxID=2508720 RepID=UPI003F66D245